MKNADHNLVTATQRGKLKIFFGAAPGVGKTYAMLSAARQLKNQGKDVVAGMVETHNRGEVYALLSSLEQLALKEIPYREKAFQEFDLEAALARRPAIVLVDELAHSNISGTRHPKRWQDVEELLSVGIDVMTTLNVHHLESLNDIVGGITGIRVNETVPDRVFDQADEIVLVDLPPDDLLARLREGKIYLPEQSEQAIQNFFRKSNLIALRELALRRTANRVDDEMRSSYSSSSSEGRGSISSLLSLGEGLGMREKSIGSLTKEKYQFKKYLWSLLISIATTLLATPLLLYFDLANIVMLFLLATVIVAAKYGRGPAIFAAIINVIAFDVFFVPPRFSLAVADIQYLLTFFIMLVVGLIIAQLTSGLRHQATIASEREKRAHALYEMARELSSTLTAEHVAEIGSRFVEKTFSVAAVILLPDTQDKIQTPITQSFSINIDIAQWVLDKNEPAGINTNTLPTTPAIYLPLKAPMRTRGVMVVEPGNTGLLINPEQRQQLETFAVLVAIALERVHFVAVAQDTLVHMESERLRNSLLTALSHDLRTPLTALLGTAESLYLSSENLNSKQLDSIQAIRQQALRTTKLINNLLDMARLESNQTRLRKDWQSIEELIGAALKENEAQLQGRSVHVDIQPQVSLIRCDATLIERVLVNLLENAGKYTAMETAIGINVSIEKDYVHIEVWDEGKGLPKGMEQAIFEKFTRGNLESNIPGTGLGLAICKTVVEAHGGKIWAENREAGGASFIFTLPRETPPSIEVEQEMELKESSSKPRSAH